MKEIVIDVYCELCQEKIKSPSEANMDAFRLGIACHTKCLSIADRWIKIYSRLIGRDILAN